MDELYAKESSRIDDAFRHIQGSITYTGCIPDMFSTYVGAIDSVRYATTIESPYFGNPDNMMTDERFIKSGVAFAKAIKQLIKEVDNQEE